MKKKTAGKLISRRKLKGENAPIIESTPIDIPVFKETQEEVINRYSEIIKPFLELTAPYLKLDDRGAFLEPYRVDTEKINIETYIELYKDVSSEKINDIEKEAYINSLIRRITKKNEKLIKLQNDIDSFRQYYNALPAEHPGKGFLLNGRVNYLHDGPMLNEQIEKVIILNQAKIKALENLKTKYDAVSKNKPHEKNEDINDQQAQILWRWNNNLLPYLFQKLGEAGAIPEMGRVGNDIAAALDGVFVRRNGNSITREDINTWRSQYSGNLKEKPRNYKKIDDIIDSIEG